MIKAIIIAVLTLVFASVAYASCGEKSKVLFTCSTAKGKQLEVCNFGKTVRYSYGRPNAKPEIIVKVPREKVTGISWHASGRYITNAVNVPNGNTIYRISWSGDKLQESDKLEGGVEVLVNDELKSRIYCQSEPTIDNTEGIHFEEASGQ